MTAEEDEASELDRLRAEVAGLRAENAELRTVVEQLEGAKAVLHHFLLEARAIRGGGRRFSREDVKLLGDPHAGSA